MTSDSTHLTRESTTETSPYRAFQRRSGTFAILAIDQRETLRSLMRRVGKRADAGSLRTFKREVIRVTLPHVSGVLLDAQYGLRAIETLDRTRLPGLLLAADSLTHDRASHRVVSSTIDEHAMVRASELGIGALKLLALWRPGVAEREHRSRLVAAFISRCRDMGVLSVLEGVVADADDHGAIVSAARELMSFGPDIYKTEIPTRGTGSARQIERLSQEISDAATMPWVVLSGGVRADRFEEALRAACAGGASGFMAGRYLWADAVNGDAAGLEEVRAKASRLSRIVDRDARPWFGGQSRG